MTVKSKSKDLETPVTEIYTAGEDLPTVYKAVGSTLAVMDKGNLSVDRATLFNMIGEPLLLKDNLGKQLDIMGHMLTDMDITDKESGEIKTVPALYLFSKDVMYLTVSGTAIRRYEQLVRIMGTPSEWGDGLKLVFDKKVSGNNSVYYTCKLV